LFSDELWLQQTDRQTDMCIYIYIHLFYVVLYVTFDLKLSKLIYFVRVLLMPLTNSQIKQNCNILTKS